MASGKPGAVQGEHVVRACVLGIEPAGGDSVLLILGEADPTGTADPPRIKARLNPAERSVIAAERGGSFDPASLVNRAVEIQLRTSLRQRFGRGAGVQAKVVGLMSVGNVSIDIILQREAVLQRLRLTTRLRRTCPRPTSYPRRRGLPW